MTLIKIQWRGWLFIARLGLYKFGCGHRVWWDGTAENWDAALGVLWLYVSRRRE
jgi:hypothetical protein